MRARVLAPIAAFIALTGVAAGAITSYTDWDGGNQPPHHLVLHVQNLPTKPVAHHKRKSHSKGTRTRPGVRHKLTGRKPLRAPGMMARPVISGTAVVGDTLSSDAGSWSGSPTSYGYQWKDCDAAGADCAAIAGATKKSYTLAGGDAGHTVAVTVAATNAGGSTSATAAVTDLVTEPSSPPAPPAPSAPANLTAPVITGTAEVGDQLSATTGSWTNSPTSYAYQWQDCDALGLDCTDIAGASAATYVLGSSDAGDTIAVIVTATGAGGSTPASSAVTAPVTQPPSLLAPVDLLAPTISGTAQVGDTVTADNGTWLPLPSGYTYQWQDCDTAGQHCTAIDGATAASYQLQLSDAGDTIEVAVTASNASGSNTASSAPTSIVTAPPPQPPVNTSAPAISGAAEVGDTLSASTGAWSGDPASYSYQWQDCDSAGSDCTNISGATGSTYVVEAGDTGDTIVVVVAATNAGGSSAASSAPTSVVTTPPPDAPVNTSPPAISGTAQAGDTLSATTGSWTNGPTSYSYQWQDCNSSGSACNGIAGATGTTYQLQDSDIGSTIRVIVTAANEGGSTAASSGATSTVSSAAPPAPVNTSAPAISGTAQTGDTLSASTGGWSNSPTAYAYQWVDCDSSGANCAAISGASASSYQLQSSDLGSTIRVVVTASNAGGSNSAASAQTTVVTNPTPPAPTSTSAPVISGTAQVGDQLSSSTGSWSGDPTSYAYQWRDCNASGSGCSNIAGATSSSYTVGDGDVGHTIEVTVTATNAGGSNSATSTATATVPSSASYRTFYIDYDSGSDANSGTSESSPWKEAPGMRGFTGNYTHESGDHFIFKGGVTWPNSEFPLAVTGSGSSSEDDYYGVDQGWYEGSSFARPIFDAGGSPITGSDPNSGGHTGGGQNDVFIDLRGVDHVEIDDIEFTGFDATSSTSYAYGDCAYIEMSSNGSSSDDQNITINRIYAHGMYIDEATGYTHECSVVQGYTNNSPYDGNSIVENSTIAGDGSTYGYAIWGVPNIENNSLHDLNELIITAGHGTIAGNQLYDCGYPNFPTDGGVATNTHNNAIETVQGNGDWYIYDNIIYDIGYDGSTGDACEPMFIGVAGSTDYVWDNVMWNDETPNQILLDESGPSNGEYVWNNTIEGGDGQSSYCIEAGHQGTDPTVVIQNNFCVSTVGAGNGIDTSGDSHSLSANSLTNSNNVLLTPSQARADGYQSDSGSYPYQPPSGSSPTSGAGTNLSSDCNGALSLLCQTTSFAGQFSASPRPSSSAWNAGSF